MHADFEVHDGVLEAGRLTPRQAFACATAVLLLVAVVYAGTAYSMVQTWWRSETFTHGFLVVPAVLAFMWMRRAELAQQPVRPAPLALVGLVAAAALWLLGELASALVLSQFAMVAMVPLTLAALAGWDWVRALAFPLAFLFFAVPFGEILVPTLIDWTADFTVAAIAASGVPVYREDNSFVIPSGRWSVVEACSGIRYLIASVMLGSLYAWVTYRSPRRRLLFIVAAILVPLVANWVRAYGIVMLGHLSDNRIAADVDHLIYGWLFFGIVMAVMFMVGARWREEAPPPVARVAQPVTEPARAAGWRRYAPLVVVVLLLGPIAAASLERGTERGPLSTLAVTPRHGWTLAPERVTAWRPHITGAAAERMLTFRRDGSEVSVFIGIYRNQRQGAELVNSTNRLVDENDTLWRIVDRRTAQLTDESGSYPARLAALRGREGALGTAQWYWTGQARTISDTRAKIDLAVDRLLMRGDTAAWIAVSTPAREGLSDAAPVLRRFVADMGAELDRALSEMAKR